MAKFPYISVIVPAYNAESTLHACVASILAQSFADFELIVVDDGSTDSSSYIIDSYVTTDSRVRHISRKNGGVSSARNAGLDVACGKYVCFVDSDDILPAGALESLAAASVEPSSAENLSRGCLSSVVYQEAAKNISSDESLSFTDSSSTTGDGSAAMVIGGYVWRGSHDYGIEVYPPTCKAYSSTNISACIDDNYRFSGSLFRAVWGKLFLRSTIGDLRFDQSFSYGEDVVFIWSFLMRCKGSELSGTSGGGKKSVCCISAADGCGTGSIVTIMTPVYWYYDTPGGLGSGLGTDRHISQLLRFIPAYKVCLENLSATFPSSKAVASMYHEDLVGRLVCRALTVFATRPTDLMTLDSLSSLYSVMDSDRRLSKSSESNGLKAVFSLRKGQILNLLLYRIHSVGFTMSFYRLSSHLCCALHIHPKKY